MKCLNDTLLQQYVDNELSIREARMVNNHLHHCEKCKSKITERKSFILFVRNIFNEALPQKHLLHK